MDNKTKYCKNCGKLIAAEAVICVECGCQVEDFKMASNQSPNIVINNANTNTNTNINALGGKAKNKWVAIILCVLLGGFGIHKFYEGKIGMGILYLCTFGLCGIGIIIDLIVLLTKPTVYYV